MILRDPVHRLISFTGEAERLLVQLMDTPEVQRLRRIRALGLASLAFPGGEHSRFAHAVGSAHVMNRYIAHVCKLSDDVPASERIDSQTAVLAQSAALLHDLGHGPFSHTFEELLPTSPSHEDWTRQIILDPSTGVNRVLREFDATAPAYVADLLNGKNPIPHLTRAVSGTFDVDRCDYLLRDSHMTGVRYGSLDLDWLLESLRLFVLPGATSATLAVHGEKGLTAVEGFFVARLYMYRQVYYHKAVRAADVVMTSLFRRLSHLIADGDTETVTHPTLRSLLIADSKKYPVSPQDYLQLDDAVLETQLARWMTAKDPIVQRLARGIRERRLFKSIRLDPDTDTAIANERLHEILDTANFDSRYFGTVDRVSINAFREDEGLVVRYSSGRFARLLEASPVLYGLSQASYVQQRAVFPEEVRDLVVTNMADFAT